MRLAKAYQDGTPDLWSRAKTEDNVILLSPEQLEGNSFRSALDDQEFAESIYLLVVDEAHLTYTWSKEFRKAYGRIGQLRNRLNRDARLLLLSATLRPGSPYKAVTDTFDLVPGRFHDIHRSNLRPEIRVITSIIHSSLTTSLNFPDLQWIIGLKGISIIFTRDRSLALRIALYLKRVDPPYADTIRKCDSTNESDYDHDTRMAIREGDHANGLILVATTILTLGIDIPNVVRVIILDPIEFDEEIQQMGRLLRQKEKGCVGEAYVYVSQSTLEKAEEMVKAHKAAKEGNKIPVTQKKATKKGYNQAKPSPPSLSLSMAYRLVAPCVTVEQNRQYGNPDSDPLCFCQSCHLLGPRRTECLCSGCKPGTCERDMIAKVKEGPRRDNLDIVTSQNENLPRELQPDTAPVMPNSVKPVKKLVDKNMRKYVTEKLVTLREQMIDEPNTNYSRHGLYTPEDIIPDAVIPLILDNFFRLDSPKILSQLTEAHQLYPDWINAIWEELRASMSELLRIHADSLKLAKAKQASTKAKARNKYLDKREQKHGIRTGLSTDDIPQFTGKRWRYFGRTFRLRMSQNGGGEDVVSSVEDEGADSVDSVESANEMDTL